MNIRGIDGTTGSSGGTLFLQNPTNTAAAKPKEEGTGVQAQETTATARSSQTSGTETTCSACGASIPSGSASCPQCGAKVETMAEKLLDQLTEALSQASYRDNGVGTLTTLQKLTGEDPEE